MNDIEEIKNFTAKKIHRIAKLSDNAARAALANLRRGVGYSPGEIPTLWGEFLLDFPQELMGKGNDASRAEWAVYIALTMFALHQQGKDKSMHQEGNSLGAAAQKLIESNDEEDRERVARRFYPVATAPNMREFSYHLRGLITLLRSKDISLDYVRLATDIYLLQNPDTADNVKLRWGEDFYRSSKEEATSEKKGE